MKRVLSKATFLLLSVCLFSSSSIAEFKTSQRPSPQTNLNRIAQPKLAPTPKIVEKKVVKKEEIKLPEKIKIALDPRTGILSQVRPNKKVFSARCSKGHCQGATPMGGSLSYDFIKGKFSNFIFKDYLGKSYNIKVVYDKLGYHFVSNKKRFGALSWNSKNALYEIDWGAICWSCIVAPTPPWAQAPIDDPLGPVCGNGRVDAREECDYANRTTYPPGFSCNTGCYLVRVQNCPSTGVASHDPRCDFLCGNGVVDLGEACDYSSPTTGPCDSNCHSLPPPCYACDSRGSCSMTPDSGSLASCGTFFSEPTCGASCPLGVGVPPTDADTALCTTPTGALPAGTIFREYPDSTQISQCQTDTSVRYTICGRSGEVTTSIGNCPARNICTNGACVELPPPPPSGSFCVDTDRGNDVHVAGTVIGVDYNGSGFSQDDSCFSITNADGTITTNGLYQYSCTATNDGFVPSTSICPTEEHCESGACLPNRTCIPECHDNDVNDDVHLRGLTSGTDDTCAPYIFYDRCVANAQLTQFSCGLDNSPTQNTTTCPGSEICATDGQCSSPCSPTCIESDSAHNVLFRGTATTTNSQCYNIIDGDRCSDSTHVEQIFCHPDNTTAFLPPTLCPDGGRCDSGVCIPPSCTRTTCEPTPATASAPGYVTGINCVVQHDICDAGSVRTYICGADGLPADGPRITCPRGCQVDASGLSIGLCNP